MLTEYNSSTAVTDALSREKFHARNMAKQITVKSLCTSACRSYWKIAKSGKTMKNRRLVLLTAFVLFIIKIKLTQYNNA